MAKESLSEAETVAGRYRVVEHLGKGGFVQAWLAEDQTTGENVCLKHPNYQSRNPESVVRQYFRHEVDVLKQLAGGRGHPSIVSYIDDVSVDALPVLVVEYVDGRPLGQIINDDGPIEDTDRIEAAGVGLMEAITYLHEQGQLYRDLKPDNVMMTDDDQPVLIDFNTAKGFDLDADPDQLDQNATKIESPFQPPELCQPKLSDTPQGPWSDVYSVGKILMYMMRGRVPNGDGQDPREFNIECPDYLAEIIHRATQEDRKDRYNNTQAMKLALTNEDASPPPQARLERLLSGETHAVAPGDILGRPGADGPPPAIAVEAKTDEPYISAVQAEVDRTDDGGWELRDCSTNGSWIHKGDRRGWIKVHAEEGRKCLKEEEEGLNPRNPDGSVPPESLELEDGDIIALVDPKLGVTYRFSPESTGLGAA
jgi:protein kinase/serine/threonine-protein kinase